MGLSEPLQRVISVCLNELPQADANTLQNVAMDFFCEGQRIRLRSLLSLMKICKLLKTVITNKQAVDRLKVSLKASTSISLGCDLFQTILTHIFETEIQHYNLFTVRSQ